MKMSFVQIDIAPAATTIPNPAVAYRSAIATLAAAEAAGEIIDDQVASLAAAFDLDRSDERSVGQECVSTCTSRWSPSHYKKNIRIHMYKDRHYTSNTKY